MRILQIFRSLQKKFSKYEPLVEVVIKQKNLQHNLKTFQESLPKGMQIAPVLKSNAYGHGLLTVAQILAKEPIAFFVVDSLYEALMLRKNGVKNAILVIGYTSGKNISNYADRSMTFAVTSIEHLRDVAQSVKKQTTIHLKIDTGMHRQGIFPKELEEVALILSQYPLLKIEGICTHLADADNEDEAFTRGQIKAWNDVHDQSCKLFPTIKYTHVAATAGAQLAGTIKANVLRLGLGLYGIAPPISDIHLLPVLELWTKISGIKKIQAGKKVGYNSTFTAVRPMTIATIPVGYFEGLDRRLSNQGVVKIQGMECPIIGRVSMNITTVDISECKNLRIGEPVLAISSRPEDTNAVRHIAKICKCIPYEVLVHIPQNLRRIVV